MQIKNPQMTMGACLCEYLRIPYLTRFPSRREAAGVTATYQLSYVLLDGARVNKHSDRNQGVQGKIEDLVTEEGDDPSSVLLNRRENMMLMFMCSIL